MSNVYDQFDAAKPKPSASPAPSKATKPAPVTDGNPFDQFDPPKRETTAPPPPNLGDLARAGAEGLVTGLPNAVAATADAQEIGRRMGFPLGADIIAGMIAPAIDPLLRKATGTGLPITQPTAGENILKGLSAVGANPNDYFPMPDTPQERIARMAGEGAISVIVPFGNRGKGLEKIFNIGKELVAGTAGGAGAGAGMEFAPDEFKPLASLAGGLAGGIAGLGVAEVPFALGRSFKRGMEYIEPVMPSRAKNIAAKQLGEAVADRGATMAALSEPAEIIPGSRPSSAQMTGDAGLQSLEGSMARNDDQFKTRLLEQREQQVQAQLAALDNVQNSGSPSAVADYFNARMRQLEDQANALYEQQAKVARGAADDLNPSRTVGEVGAQAREAVADNIRALNKEASVLWKSIDPENKIHVATEPLIRATARIYGNMSPEAELGMTAAEKSIAGLIGSYGPTLPFQRFTEIRSEISGAMRKTQSGPEANQKAYGRLTQLRSAIEDAVADSVAGKVAEDAAAVAKGAMSEEDAIAANFLRQAREWYAQRGQTGAGLAASDAVPPAGGSPPIPRNLGAEGEAGRGPAIAPRDQGLPQDVGQGVADAQTTAPGGSGVRPVSGTPAQPEGNARRQLPVNREEDGSLQGLPRKAGAFRASAYPDAQRVAENYMKKAGLPYNPPNTYAKVNPKRAARIAQAYDQMKHDPQNPEVKRAYDAMARETLAQYDAMLADGMQIEFIPRGAPDPYAGNPRNMTEDVRNNKHMWVFSTKDGFGSDASFDPVDNPLLADSGYQISGQPATINDIFRAVHDYFGHVKEGVGFRADGEENAWRAHSAMYSPEARKAMTSETRGQNSWVNYGPYGEKNRTARSEDTHYADQKIGILPDWAINEAAGDEIVTPRRDVAKRFEDTGGRSKVEADMNSALNEAVYEAMAKRLGTTVDELAKQYDLPSVTREAPKGSALYQSEAQSKALTEFINGTSPGDSLQSRVRAVLYKGYDYGGGNADQVAMHIDNDRALYTHAKELLHDKFLLTQDQIDRGSPGQMLIDEALRTWGKKDAPLNEPHKSTPIAPTFYSAVERAITASKNNKASADQWLATLKNTPGVKPEEIEWLGLEPWLRSQSGAVTKDQVSDFVRANQLEIEETNLTGLPDEDFSINWEAADPDMEWLRERSEEPGSWAHDKAKEDIASERDVDVDEIDDQDPEVLEKALEYEERSYWEEPEYVSIVDYGGHTFSLRSQYGDGVSVYDETVGKQVVDYRDLDDAEISQAIREHMYDYGSGSGDGTTRFHEYADLGGEDYTELLLKLPERDSRDYIKPSPAVSEKYKAEWETLAAEHDAARRAVVMPGNPGFDQKKLDAYKASQDAMDALHAKMIDETAAQHPLRVGQNFRQSHWDDPNVVAHVRFDTRNIGGKKTLFIQEIQSDWHQQGRDKAYDTPDLDAKREAARERANAAQKAFDDEVNRREAEGVSRLTKGRFASVSEMQKAWRDGDLDTKQYEEWRGLQEASHQYFVNRVRETPLYMEMTKANEALSGLSYPVPDAPFKTTWPELVLKRMIRHAAENGFEQITWTPGDLQNGNIVTRGIDELAYADLGDGTYLVQGKYGSHNETMTPEQIANTFGGKIAEQIISGAGDEIGRTRLLNNAEVDARRLKLDQPIRVGNHGMQTFYGKMVPNMLAKMLKKFDTKIERTPMSINGHNISAMAIPVSSKLRTMALTEGQPLFQKGKRGAIQFGADGSSLISMLKNADASTAPHELSHHFLRMYQDIVKSGKAPNAIRDDWNVVNNWWKKNAVHVAADAEMDGVTPADVRKMIDDGTTGDAAKDAAVNRGMQEQWARAFEAYLRDGTAPTVGLKRVFEQFKNWLQSIYRSITDLGVDLTPEMKGVFDRMLGAEAKPAGPPMMDAAAAQRFKQATAATKAVKDVQSGVRQMMKRPGATYPYNVTDEAVGGSLWAPGAKGAANIKNVLKGAGGAPEAKQAIEDAAMLSLRRSALKDGVVDPDKFAAWRTKHADAFSAFPELDKRMQSAAAASKTMAETAARNRQMIDSVQKTAIGKLLKLDSDGDVVGAIGTMLNGKNSVRAMRELVGTAQKNPDALAGLRRAVIEHMQNKLTTSKEALSPAMFLRYLGRNHPALSQVLSPEQINALRALGQELKRFTKSTQAPGGGSHTAERQAADRRYGMDQKPSLFRKLIVDTGVGGALGAAFHIFGPQSPVLTAGSAITSALGSHLLQSAREAGLRNARELVQEALLNPELMKSLLAKAPNKANTGSQITFAQRLAKIAAVSAVLAQE